MVGERFVGSPSALRPVLKSNSKYELSSFELQLGTSYLKYIIHLYIGIALHCFVVNT
jgi:hypothetical protein